jgi:hypothetical protein
MKPTDVQDLFVRMYSNIKSYRETLERFTDHADRSSENKEELFWYEQAQHIEDKLGDVFWRLKYLSGKVIDEGRLYHNESGRYCINDDSHYWTSGETIEFFYLTDDHEDDRNGWVISSMEHNGNDYYIVALGRDVSPRGVLVRVRERQW